MEPATLEVEVRSQFNRTRGRLAGLIESWGLEDKQERGMIATMKSLTYDAEKAIVDLVKQ